MKQFFGSRVPRRLPTLLPLALIALLLALPATRTQAFGWPNNNDSIFPPLAAAKPYINFDGKGFIIKGKRTFIVAGDMHYPRTPRALWLDRLLRIKRAGYNTVQTYAFWNFHEPREGQFDFTGDKDLDAFLKTVKSLNMYAIVRAGPYVNAEWDTGGLPVWLRFKSGLLPMTDNAQFYAAVTPYWNKLFPILAANQITKGGPIIMVQLENEHVLPGGVGGGTDLPNAYYKHYYAKARAMGLTIPLFFSGLNHNDDPAGDSPFDTSQRTSPWYSTEFWTGWVGRYGVDPDRGKKLERTTWKVIAFGGAGYTHYTMAGGTDFDTWNNDEQAASYDFGSPIGQTGDLRDDYYFCKRAAMFATSMAPILANSVAAAGGGGAAPTDPRLQITSRKGKAGQILFLDNRTGEAIKTQIKMADGKVFPAAGPVTLAPGEIMPVIKGFPVLPGVNLTLGAGRILGVAQSGPMTTLIVYGAAGEPAEMHFAAAGAKIVQQPVGKPLTVTPDMVLWRATIPATTPSASVFKVGTRLVRVLAMTTERADRTWLLKDDSLIACGPDYVGEVQDTPQGLRLDTERRGLGPAPKPAMPALLYTASVGAPFPMMPVAVPGTHPILATAPALAPWRVDAAVPEAQTGFDDKGWKVSPAPLAMGADGDYSAYAWYRTSVTVPKAGDYQLNLSDAGDWVTVFVNGKRASSDGPRTRYQNAAPRRLVVPLTAGKNALAFLTAHYGRNKLFNYYGLLDTIDAKGISGPVSLSPPSGTVGAQITAFREQLDPQAPLDSDTKASPTLDTSGKDWQDTDNYKDVFNGTAAWAWYRATLPEISGPHRHLHFTSIDDYGVVFLNGKQIDPNVAINADRDVSLDDAWKEGGPNVLAVAVHNTGGGGNLGEVRLEADLPPGKNIAGWKMHGGVVMPSWNAAVWKPNAPAAAPGVPAFYATTFQAVQPGPVGPYPVLRLSMTGMSRGFVWLNGRNLGRYPEKSPVEGVYLPPSLLRPGGNHLVVFDEDGAAPGQMHVIVEAVASRVGVVLAPAGKMP